jgi:hypothetical protein
MNGQFLRGGHFLPSSRQRANIRLFRPFTLLICTKNWQNQQGLVGIYQPVHCSLEGCFSDLFLTMLRNLFNRLQQTAEKGTALKGHGFRAFFLLV